MRFAVISDIHGNIDALDRVLADTADRDVDFILCTGDLVGYLPFPNEVVDRLRERKIPAIKGNHDKAVAQYKDSGASSHSNRVITDANREYLAALPERIRIDGPEASFLLVHGSPRRIDEYMHDEGPLLKELAGSFEEDAVIFGHTHKPFHRAIEGKHFINAGSAGKPRHGSPAATYVVVEARHGHIRCETIEVAYDLDRIRQAILDEPDIDNKLVRLLEKGI